MQTTILRNLSALWFCGPGSGVQLRKADSQAITEGDFLFDFERMIFSVKGQTVELSKTEQKLLRILVENKGKTVSRELLIDGVWDGDSEYVDSHALTVTIKKTAR